MADEPGPVEIVSDKKDLKAGFHQIPQDEESSQLCNFHSPFGLYRYKRPPFGIMTASEVFQREMLRNFSEFGECLVDDILIHGKTRQKHDEKLKKALDKARKIGAKFDPDKLVVGATSVKCAGMIISAEDIFQYLSSELPQKSAFFSILSIRTFNPLFYTYLKYMKKYKN